MPAANVFVHLTVSTNRKDAYASPQSKRITNNEYQGNRNSRPSKLPSFERLVVSNTLRQPLRAKLGACLRRSSIAEMAKQKIKERKTGGMRAKMELSMENSEKELRRYILLFTTVYQRPIGIAQARIAGNEARMLLQPFEPTGNICVSLCHSFQAFISACSSRIFLPSIIVLAFPEPSESLIRLPRSQAPYMIPPSLIVFTNVAPS
mmetsp:Transcript_61581/g.97648  ORF Transcript_61581/g.97648 Transcript_61581/m.97648 type:complete len:206 (+) Transcript_61581:740-1357(+)